MAPSISRRDILRLAAIAGPVSALPSAIGRAAQNQPPEQAYSFPNDFIWGTATAAYQVEGAVKEDGRGPSIWDTFCHLPNKIHGGDTGDVADDEYHRFAEDIERMNWLGVKAYRFSISWSRLFPKGDGKPNPKGFDYYDRLVDALLEARIQPYCTLYHWDLPQALQDRYGGWQSAETAKAFATYASAVAKRLSDRVKYFMTMNEIRSVIGGYGRGGHAPGLQVGRQGVAQVTHWCLYGHGLATQAIRAVASPSVKIGLAEAAFNATPLIETKEHIEAARLAMREENADILNAIMEGRYTNLYLNKLGPNAPKFTATEMKIIGQPINFLGMNVYHPAFVIAANSQKGYAVVPRPPGYPTMESKWETIGPEAMYWGPKMASDVWQVKEIFITENGCASEAKLNPDGGILDSDRIMYLRNYLTQLHRGISHGIPVKAYFLWSLLDNFEWALGYSQRFGLFYVDFATQKRIPKMSAEFYKTVIAHNALA